MSNIEVALDFDYLDAELGEMFLSSSKRIFLNKMLHWPTFLIPVTVDLKHNLC